MLILKKTKQNCTLATLVISKKKKKGGSIGIVLHCDCFEPVSNCNADNLAVQRA